MEIGYVIKPDFSNHQIIGCLSLCSATTSLIINTATKMWINLRKVDWDVSDSTHIFTACFVLTIFIPLIQTTRDASMVLYPLTGYNKWTKFHPLLWFFLIILGIQMVAMDLCDLPSRCWFWKKNITINSDFVSVEYNQILQLYFGGNGGVL